MRRIKIISWSFLLLISLVDCKSEVREQGHLTQELESSEYLLNATTMVEVGLEDIERSDYKNQFDFKISKIILDEDLGKLQVRYKLKIKDAPLDVSLQFSRDGHFFNTVISESVKGNLKVDQSGEYQIEWEYGGVELKTSSVIRLVTSSRGDVVPANILLKQIERSVIDSDLSEVVGSRNYFDSLSIVKMNKVIDYITATALSSGMMVRKQEFDNQRIRSENIPRPVNIIASKPGLKNPEQVIVILFHIDTVKQSPGADDNGSGIAAALSLMKAIGKYQFEKTIHFVAVNLEEVGLLGSYVYVEEGGIGDQEKIIGGFNIDMIGYTSDEPYSQIIPEGFETMFPEIYSEIEENSFRGDFTIAVANNSAENLSDNLKLHAVNHVPKLKIQAINLNDNGASFPELRRGDHVHFWDKNVPMIYLGDGADSRNRNYHSKTDVIQTLNMDHISNLTKALFLTVFHLALPVEGEEISISLAELQN